jgi:glycine cleavage system transcriptional repressor
VLNVMAGDHPGIISAVSGVIISLAGNIDACSQTVLGGYFTQILVVSFPESVEPETLAKMVGDSQSGNSGLQVVARRFSPPAAPARGAAVDTFVVTAFGCDQPGIIHRFSQYLSGKDINIVDLYWDCKEGEFVLISQVEIPSRWEIRMLQADLEEMARELGFTVRLQHENIFVATNQLRLTRV